MEFLLDLIGAAQANPALREHAALFKEFRDVAVKQVGDLQQKVLELEAKCQRLEKEASLKKEKEEFIERRGVLFKRGFDGRIERDAYCKSCLSVMTGIEGSGLGYFCSRCRTNVGLTPDEIDAVITGIEKAEG